jgi:hypothetical protein
MLLFLFNSKSLIPNAIFNACALFFDCAACSLLDATQFMGLPTGFDLTPPASLRASFSGHSANSNYAP